jgi:hypothetical protein
MVKKFTLIDRILMVENFVSMSVFSGRTNCALSGTRLIDSGTIDWTNRYRKRSNQVTTSPT